MDKEDKKFMYIGICICLLILLTGLGIGYIIGDYEENINSHNLNESRFKTINTSIFIISIGICIGLIFHGFPFKFDFSHNNYLKDE